MLQLAPNRKRIHTAVDSSGDEEQSVKTELTVKEKEGRLIAVKKALPQCDTMVNSCIHSLPLIFKESENVFRFSYVKMCLLETTGMSILRLV